MRNRFPGKCFRCEGWVATGAGHPHLEKGQWLVRHAYFGECEGVTCEMARKQVEKPEMRRYVSRLRGTPMGA